MLLQQAVGRLQCMQMPMCGAVRAPSYLHFHAEIRMSKYYGLAVEPVRDAHKLMELTTQSIAKQDGNRQNEVSSIAEASLVTPLRRCKPDLHPTALVSCSL